MIKTVKPKKFLGQHFLTDLSVAERIADTLEDFKSIPVLEMPWFCWFIQIGRAHV